jgi:hypothetical protein
MARLARAEVFSPDEIAIVHVINRVVRRCFLLGNDPITGKNFDHRKRWIEELLERMAANFGIDLLSYAILSNHFHLILRSRPDVVVLWNDTDVAKRWLILCPLRKKGDGSPEEPNEFEIAAIVNDPNRLAEIRLLCQRIAIRANFEDAQEGKFWQSRYRAVRLLDEQAVLAASAYVDLNPIRAAMAETLETSDYTSVQRRIQAFMDEKIETSSENQRSETDAVNTRADQALSPLAIDERHDPIGPHVSNSTSRCSDKGFLAISMVAYLQLLDWTARQLAAGKAGFTPEDVPPILERFNLDAENWLSLVKNFGRKFYHVAGTPTTISETRSRKTGRRFYARRLEAYAESA